MLVKKSSSHFMLRTFCRRCLSFKAKDLLARLRMAPEKPSTGTPQPNGALVTFFLHRARKHLSFMDIIRDIFGSRKHTLYPFWFTDLVIKFRYRAMVHVNTMMEAPVSMQFTYTVRARESVAGSSADDDLLVSHQFVNLHIKAQNRAIAFKTRPYPFSESQLKMEISKEFGKYDVDIVKMEYQPETIQRLLLDEKRLEKMYYDTIPCATAAFSQTLADLFASFRERQKHNVILPLFQSEISVEALDETRQRWSVSRFETNPVYMMFNCYRNKTWINRSLDETYEAFLDPRFGRSAAALAVGQLVVGGMRTLNESATMESCFAISSFAMLNFVFLFDAYWSRKTRELASCVRNEMDKVENQVRGDAKYKDGIFFDPTLVKTNPNTVLSRRELQAEFLKEREDEDTQLYNHLSKSLARYISPDLDDSITVFKQRGHSIARRVTRLKLSPSPTSTPPTFIPDTDDLYSALNFGSLSSIPSNEDVKLAFFTTMRLLHPDTEHVQPNSEMSDIELSIYENWKHPKSSQERAHRLSLAKSAYSRLKNEKDRQLYLEKCRRSVTSKMMRPVVQERTNDWRSVQRK